MTKTRAELTELEGAVLGVLRRAPGATAYRVRQVFQASRSIEWSGSAGAIYPAIARLVAEGLLAEESGADRRGTHTYVLTRLGKARHDAWLCDLTRALSPGLDPFRTRAPLWLFIGAPQRRTLLAGLHRECLVQRRELAATIPTLDADDAVAAELHIGLLDLRSRWIEDQQRRAARDRAKSRDRLRTQRRDAP